MIFVILLLLGPALGAAEISFEAVWKRPLRPDKQGLLRISDASVAFQPHGAEGPDLEWVYEDIQHLDRLSASELALLSYDEGHRLSFGRDRRYRFSILDGTLSDDIFLQLAKRVGRPATDRTPQVPAVTEFELPVKRLSRFGASQGTLYVTAAAITYVSANARESRHWLIDRDLESVWSADPYRLEVHAFEGREGALRRPKIYRFALKRPLRTERYRQLKMKFFKLERLKERLR